jgi:hypothetical protein
MITIISNCTTSFDIPHFLVLFMKLVRSIYGFLSLLDKTLPIR